MLKTTVITPTTGSPTLARAIRSVAEQDGPTHHLLVVDGKEHHAKAERIARDNNFAGDWIVLPQPTGRNNFFGHRIYAAAPLLSDADLIAYLDEDNWYEPNHISTATSLIGSAGLDWAYSLRNIVDSAGLLVCRDNCQSLGWWPAFDGAYHHVDTSCYVVRREVAIEAAALWHRRGYVEGVRDPDREYCRWLLFHYPNAFTTAEYSVNYRLGSNLNESRFREYYLFGNSVAQKTYAVFPWLAATIDKGSEEKRHLVFAPKNPQIEKLVGPIPGRTT